MNEYTKCNETVVQESRSVLTSILFNRVYWWMCIGLLISGICAWMVANNDRLSYAFYSSIGPMIFCGILQLVLVFSLNACIHKISSQTATVLFVIYSIVSGITLSSVFLVFELAEIQEALFLTGGMFGGLALFGTVTKKDLSGIGTFCGMALWGLILMGIINLFTDSRSFNFAYALFGIIIFTGLTAWDAQKIKELAAKEHTLDAETIKKLSIIGALELYLDFINLFLFILRLFYSRD